MDERVLNATEAARRLGVTPKALRLYEQHGLVTPVRSEAGWRTYGSDQIARLHQVVALKSLGLSLSAIAKLMAGSADTLDAVLSVQERALKQELQRGANALSLIQEARQKLALGVLLTIDDLATL